MTPRRPLGRTADAAWWGAPAAPRNQKMPRGGLRRFDGARYDRLTADWRGTNLSIDYELRTDLTRLRMRSRDLAKNNSYAKKFFRMVRANVVGAEGFKLQCKAADPNGGADKIANDAIEAAFAKWALTGSCEVTGKLSFVDVCRLLAFGLPRDGEFIVRHVRGVDVGPFGYQLQLLDMARLDTNYNVPGTGTSNAVVMGVEKTPAGRPVAFHMFTQPQMPGQLQISRDRVPASEILHCFIAEESEQTRGIPWLHATMRDVNDLRGYREAAIIAARVGASKMGVWTSPDGTPPLSAGDVEGEDGEGGSAGGDEYITEANPGSFDFAPEGYTLEKFDPAYPHDQFDAFCKATLRGIASGAGCSYNSLANDLEGVNFSSIRAGVLEDRDEWMTIQNWMIGAFVRPVFMEWLQCALLMGAIMLPNGKPLPATKLPKYAEHLWQGRRWSWVDPSKDIQAWILAINNGLASPEDYAAQTGRDVEDVLDDIAKFQEMVRQKNIVLYPGTGSNVPPETDKTGDGTQPSDPADESGANAK